MQSLYVAVKGKGFRNTVKRAGIIWDHYSLSPGKMERQLDRFIHLLGRFDCGATFPITAVALARSRRVVQKYLPCNVEFSVHGCYHIDHTRLSVEQQAAHFSRARQIFVDSGIACPGFRAPYLRWNQDTLAAVKQAGFSYDTSLAVVWDVAAGLETDDYWKVLDFYGSVWAKDRLSLPYWEQGLLRIPYCVPDDEALVDRFHLSDSEKMLRVWSSLLMETYAQGELFCLGLHPERLSICEYALAQTLQQAGSLLPRVWNARLDEVAAWWIALEKASFVVYPAEDGHLCVEAHGPAGSTLLVRGAAPLSPTFYWDGAYRRVQGNTVVVAAAPRPLIGVSSRTPDSLVRFLRQQGYFVERTEPSAANQPLASQLRYACFLDRPEFSPADERPLLAEIEAGSFPLVRLGRWPGGARSALSVTGDIDALTLLDYALRLVRR